MIFTVERPKQGWRILICNKISVSTSTRRLRDCVCSWSVFQRLRRFHIRCIMLFLQTAGAPTSTLTVNRQPRLYPVLAGACDMPNAQGPRNDRPAYDGPRARTKARRPYQKDFFPTCSTSFRSCILLSRPPITFFGTVRIQCSSTPEPTMSWPFNAESELGYQWRGARTKSCHAKVAKGKRLYASSLVRQMLQEVYCLWGTMQRLREPLQHVRQCTL